MFSFGLTKEKKAAAGSYDPDDSLVFYSTLDKKSRSL